MKAIIYRGGEHGTVATLSGDNPMAELEELLGGPVELTVLTRRLNLVSRADGEELQLPIRYSVHWMDRCPEPVAGDCAVVARLPNLMLTDINAEDLAKAETLIRATGGKR